LILIRLCDCNVYIIASVEYAEPVLQTSRHVTQQDLPEKLTDPLSTDRQSKIGAAVDYGEMAQRTSLFSDLDCLNLTIGQISLLVADSLNANQH